jgi:DNA-binding transcriptional MerR regulator
LYSKEKIPSNKLFYKISEASHIIGVEPSVLRYWESEFPSLKPKKKVSGQRLYTQKDIESALEIKELLYKQKFTINGARKKLKKRQIKNRKEPLEVIEDIKIRLVELLKLLES